MSEVYRKNAKGRYEKMGWEFTGFPSNGVWLVKDGSQNCMVRMGDIDTTPNFYIDFAKFENEHSGYIMDKASKVGSYSIVDVTRWSSEFWAIKQEEQLLLNKAKGDNKSDSPF